MPSPFSNIQVVTDMIDAVWSRSDLDALSRYWTQDCVNHAAPEDGQTGLEALTAYHRGFADQLAGFDEVRIEILQQVASDDRVVTQLRTTARHVELDRKVHLDTIRIDRLEGDRIAEHWSVADLAGLQAQLS